MLFHFPEKVMAAQTFFVEKGSEPLQAISFQVMDKSVGRNVGRYARTYAIGSL